MFLAQRWIREGYKVGGLMGPLGEHSLGGMVGNETGNSVPTLEGALPGQDRELFIAHGRSPEHEIKGHGRAFWRNQCLG